MTRPDGVAGRFRRIEGQIAGMHYQGRSCPDTLDRLAIARDGLEAVAKHVGG